jgi:hypothetical protein
MGGTRHDPPSKLTYAELRARLRAICDDWEKRDLSGRSAAFAMHAITSDVRRLLRESELPPGDIA